MTATWKPAMALLAAAVALLGYAGPAGALPSDLPAKPYDLGDLYVVERNGSWFCPDQSGGPSKHCANRSSQQAAMELVHHMANNIPGRPRLLRVAKARKECPLGTPAQPPGTHDDFSDRTKCWTGVPPRASCSSWSWEANPQCLLKWIKGFGVGLGVIVGAEEDGDSGTGRSAAELAWHACEIRKQDVLQSDDPTTPGVEVLYDFIFIDEARFVDTATLRNAVRHITRGEYADGTPCDPGVRGWKVITNDNGWQTHGSGRLDTGAWGHTKQLEVLSGGNWNQKVNDSLAGTKPWIRDSDRAFVQAVQDVDRDSAPARAILRVEVTGQTQRLASRSGEHQCTLLRGVADSQTTSFPHFAFIYPLYIHSQDPARHYDSIARGTFRRQLELMHKWGGPDERPGYVLQPPCPRHASATPPPGQDANGPSAVVGGQTAYVFWRGTDSNLWQAQGDPRGALAGPFGRGMGPLGSSTTAAIDGGGATYVYWKGQDGNLWQGFWNGTGWEGPYAPGMGPLSSPPSAVMGPNRTAYVFWRGTDGQLWQAQGDPRGQRGWLTGPYLRGMGPLGSSPTAAIDANGATYVYWKGTEGNLWEGFWNGSGWVGPFNRGMGPLGSAPSAVIGPNGTAYVFWRGTDGQLWQAQGDPRGGLAGPFARGMGPLGSSPTASIDASGATYVYWKGTEGNLWEGFWNGSGWVGPFNRGMGPLG